MSDGCKTCEGTGELRGDPCPDCLPREEVPAGIVGDAPKPPRKRKALTIGFKQPPTLRTVEQVFGVNFWVAVMPDGAQVFYCGDGEALNFPRNDHVSSWLGREVFGDAFVLEGWSRWRPEDLPEDRTIKIEGKKPRL